MIRGDSRQFIPLVLLGAVIVSMLACGGADEFTDLAENALDEQDGVGTGGP